MGNTKIEWTGKTWNPIRARNKATGELGWYCEHISEGCRNCYAEKMNVNTYFGNGLPYKRAWLDDLDLFLDKKILEQPLRWRKPTKIFPCSMTDLFGRFVKDEWLDKIHHVMWRASQHTFQLLTKRADRMRDYMRSPNTPNQKPLPNVWLGVSVEDQKTADERIPLLLETPAAVRWISAEPLLGPINLFNAACGYDKQGYRKPLLTNTWLDWVVVGGESGPKARPMHPDWARSLRDQCVSAGVPFFFKQWGNWTEELFIDTHDVIPIERRWAFDDNVTMVRVGKKAAGRLLDGKEWSQSPP